MKLLRLIYIFIMLGTALLGCTTQLVEQFSVALAKVPFVDRTEKEINDWFYSRPIIDDKKILSSAINGDPRVQLIDDMNKCKINGINYSGVLCITQTNTLPGGQPVKYAVLAGIHILNNADLFECGEIDLSEKSCDDDPMAVNVVSFHTIQDLEKAFREAVNNWLKNDIVKTLKSTSNKEGFVDPATAQPRLPATARGSLYNIVTEAGPPAVKTIGFFAQ